MIYVHDQCSQWSVIFIIQFPPTLAPQQSTVESSEEKQSDPEDGQDKS